MEKVTEIKWAVKECIGKRMPTKLPGSYYWNVVAHYADHYSILESGVMPSKVEALTRARGRARFYRAEKSRGT